MTYTIGSMFSQAALLNHPFDDYFNVITNMNPLAYFPLINSFDNFGTVKNVVTVNNRERIKLLSEGGARFTINSDSQDGWQSSVVMSIGSTPSQFTFGYKLRMGATRTTNTYATICEATGFDSYGNPSSGGSIRSFDGTSDQFNISLTKRAWINVVVRVNIGATSTFWLDGSQVTTYTGTRVNNSTNLMRFGIVFHGANIIGYHHDLKDVFFFNRLLTDSEIYGLL